VSEQVPKISLATYSVRIREKYGRGFLPLDDVNGGDLLDMLREYADDRSADYLLDDGGSART
jgi:hypothetical protein